MADGIGVYQITGSVETTVINISTLVCSNSFGSISGLNSRRSEAKKYYTSYLTSSNSPSWTQQLIGKKHAFVLTPMSSSNELMYSWNAYMSGS
jgi:hypothetical protein